MTFLPFSLRHGWQHEHQPHNVFPLFYFFGQLFMMIRLCLLPAVRARSFVTNTLTLTLALIRSRFITFSAAA